MTSAKAEVLEITDEQFLEVFRPYIRFGEPNTQFTALHIAKKLCAEMGWPWPEFLAEVDAK